jgi:hypothetical protein
MTFQRRFAPIGGRFDPESLAGLTGIYKISNRRLVAQYRMWTDVIIIPNPLIDNFFQ